MEVETAVGMGGIQAAQLDPPGRAASKLLGHHFPPHGAHHHPVAAADWRRRRDDDHVAVAEHRFHRLAADLQRVGIGVGDFRQGHLIPAAADRIAAVVEDIRRRRPARSRSAGCAGRWPDCAAAGRQGAGAGDQRGEGVECGAGRVQHLGQAFGARPSGAPVRHTPLGRVERGGVQPGPLGQAGRGEPVLGGERVERPPDVIMLHASGPISGCRSCPAPAALQLGAYAQCVRNSRQLK